MNPTLHPKLKNQEPASEEAWSTLDCRERWNAMEHEGVLITIRHAKGFQVARNMLLFRWSLIYPLFSNWPEVVMLEGLLRYFDLYSGKPKDDLSVLRHTVLYATNPAKEIPAEKARAAAADGEGAWPPLPEEETYDAEGRFEVAEFEDLEPIKEIPPPLGPPHPPRHPIALFQWLALFAGVLIQPFFQTYQSTHKWAFDGLSGWALFALITSVLVFPAVYRNAFDSDKPVVVQLAPIFAAGLGWQSLLTTVVKAAAGK